MLHIGGSKGSAAGGRNALSEFKQVEAVKDECEIAKAIWSITLKLLLRLLGL